MTQLGQMLATQIAQEREAGKSAQRQAAKSQSDEALRKFNEVEAFFTKAREYFIRGITEGTPSKPLFIQVGGKRNLRDDREDHQAIYTILEGWNYDAKGISSLESERGTYRSLWLEFKQWAHENGLHAMFNFEHDGVGIQSWWVLRVAPAKAAATDSGVA